MMYYDKALFVTGAEVIVENLNLYVCIPKNDNRSKIMINWINQKKPVDLVLINPKLNSIDYQKLKGVTKNYSTNKPFFKFDTWYRLKRLQHMSTTYKLTDRKFVWVFGFAWKPTDKFELFPYEIKYFRKNPKKFMSTMNY